MPKRIKILFVVKNLAAGGAQIRTVRLANELSRTGFRVSIASLGKTDRISGELSDDVDLSFSERFDALRAVPVLPSFLSSAYGLCEVIRRIRLADPDVVCAMHWAAKMPTALAGALLGKKTVLVEVNSSMHELRLKGAGGSLHPRFLARKTACRLAAAVAANSRGLADFTASFYGLREVVLIRNGTDAEAVRRMSAEPAESFWKDEDIPVAVASGRLEKQKGFESLIEAVRLLRDEGTKVRLLILGEGKLRGSLEKKIADCGIGDMVVLGGFALNPYSLMATADLFVCSSLSEGMSNAILEAMALGLPVVSTDHEFGAGEIVRHGESGLLVPVGDPGAMADAIRDVAGNDGLREKLARGAEEAVRKFTFRSMAEKYGELFVSVSGR